MSQKDKHILTRREALRFIGAGVGTSALAGLCLPLSGCSTLDFFLESEREVTDDTGRVVTVPAEGRLKSIYFTSALAQIFCFTVAPDLLAATSINFSADQLEYLPEGTENLSYLGSLSQGGQLDIDALKREGVQLIFSISGTDLSDVNIEDALALEKESGIPVFLIDGSYDVIEDTYHVLGECLGRRERAEELATYCSSVRSRVREALSRVPDNELVRYYYAEGPEGLQTEPDNSQHALIFHEACGINAAATIEGNTERNRASVSLEQVVEWNPQVIIAWSQRNNKGSDAYIRQANAWSGIDAVKNNRVYTMPSIPFPFCDRPPGINRFLGVQWLASVFYPEYFDADMVDIVREFYAKCYWRDITVEQAQYILQAGNPD